MKKQSADVYTCPIVSLQASLEEFNTQVFRHMKTHSILALTDLSDELVGLLETQFEVADSVFDTLQDESVKKKYPPLENPNGYSGLFTPELYSNLHVNGPRFFISFDNNGKIINDKLPKLGDNKDMAESAHKYNQLTNHIAARVIAAIEIGLNVPTGELQQYVIGRNSLSFNRYYPVTQRRLATLFKDNVLSTQTEGDRVTLFLQHRDLAPLAILAYRGMDCTGMEVEADKIERTMLPLHVDNQGKPYLIVFAGTCLKELTNGQIRPKNHRVVTYPEHEKKMSQKPTNQWRHCAAKFLLMAKDEIRPVKDNSGMPLKSDYERRNERKYPLKSTEYFQFCFDRAHEKQNKMRAKSFPIALARKFPQTVKHKEVFVAQLGENSIGEITKQDLEVIEQHTLTI